MKLDAINIPITIANGALISFPGQSTDQIAREQADTRFMVDKIALITRCPP